jgi:hypothetical protein
MTETRIADIYDPHTGTWWPQPVSGPPVPRERLPNNTMHLPHEERERIRVMGGEAMLADVEAVANGLLLGRDIPRERAEEAERLRASGSQYTFPCPFLSIGPGTAWRSVERLRGDLASLEADLEANSGLVILGIEFNRSHAIVRTHPALAVGEHNRFKAVFADFRERATSPDGMTGAEREERRQQHRKMIVARYARLRYADVEAMSEAQLERALDVIEANLGPNRLKQMQEAQTDDSASENPLPRVEHIRTNPGLRRVLEAMVADETSIPREEVETWSPDKLDAAESALQGARLITSAPAWREELRARLGDDLERLWPVGPSVSTLTVLGDLGSFLFAEFMADQPGPGGRVQDRLAPEAMGPLPDEDAVSMAIRLLRLALARGAFRPSGAAVEPSSGPGDSIVGVDMSAGTDMSVVQRVAVVDGRAEVVGEGVVVDQPRVAMDGAAVAEAHTRAGRKGKRERGS